MAVATQALLKVILPRQDRCKSCARVAFLDTWAAVSEEQHFLLSSTEICNVGSKTLVPLIEGAFDLVNCRNSVFLRKDRVQRKCNGTARQALMQGTTYQGTRYPCQVIRKVLDDTLINPHP